MEVGIFKKIEAANLEYVFPELLSHGNCTFYNSLSQYIHFYLTLGLLGIFFPLESFQPFENCSRRTDFISQRIALIRHLNSKGQNKVRVFLTTLEKMTAENINFEEKSHLKLQQCSSLKRSTSYVLFEEKNVKIFNSMSMTLSQMQKHIYHFFYSFQLPLMNNDNIKYHLQKVLKFLTDSNCGIN